MAQVKIVNSPAEAEQAEDQLTERDATAELSAYTSAQLVRDFTRRDGFIGLVIVHPKEMFGAWELGPGVQLNIHACPQLGSDDVEQFLRDSLTAMEEQDEPDG